MARGPQFRHNWVDRAIGVFAPGLAARRIRQRTALDMMTRGYDGAAKGRSNAGWFAKNSSADAEIAVSGPILRDRMRDLVRNNPHAAKAISVLATNLVGTGIVPRAKTGNDAADAKINALFERWSKSASSNGQLDFYGLQTQAVREMLEGGEVFARLRRRRREDRLPVPLQIELYEADQLDATQDRLLPSGSIVQGIELDRVGRRVAYWIFPEHPGAPRGFQSARSRRVPAEDVAHLYEPQRVQLRGVPWGSPAIQDVHELDDYDAAENMRKKLEACVVGIVTGGGEEALGVGIPDDGGSMLPGVYDASGAMVERFEPGMFAYAFGGKDIRFNQPTANGSYEASRRVSLLTIAAGFRVPYELLSGDLSHVSFISGRLGLLEFRQLMTQVQWQIIIPKFCQRIWDWWCSAAYDAGLIETDSVPVEWAPPRFPDIDPQNTAQANLLEMRSGTKSWQEVVAETGRDPDQVLAEIIAAAKKFDAAGLVFDSDPRKVAKSGVLQVADPAETGSGRDPPPKPKD